MLKEILSYKTQEVRKIYKNLKEIKEKLKIKREILDFKRAIMESDKRIKIIGEIKRSSPSCGFIKDINPVEYARIYRDCGVVALSVLADKFFFNTGYEYINEIKQNINLPILYKDFVIDEVQIYQAYISGADAVLLIAFILKKEELKDLYNLCRELSLVPIVELHFKEDIEKIKGLEFEILGVNNRNLKNFEISLDTSVEFRKILPADIKIISESGIKLKEDIIKLYKAGIDTFLIGESILKSQNPYQTLRDFLNPWD